MRADDSGQRLVEIDALRGLAALSVVLYHYTTRFIELYQPATQPLVSISMGHYGVNLFFIISGFVIFMTLERTRQPSDFVVSRFSRLFPAYWASIVLTFAITHWLGLPGRLVEPQTALANSIMLHGFFRVTHVDGVYWTLEVELLFYFCMFALYLLGWLRRVQQVMMALLLLRLVYFSAAHFFGIDLPWTISRLLNLSYIPWFTLGISAYLLTKPDVSVSGRPLVTAACAVLTLLVTESATVALLAMVLTSIVVAAGRGYRIGLRLPSLVWLGTISYPLYLLHEYIGWSLQLRLLALGCPINLAIAATLALVLCLAALVSQLVEQPAMRWIRARYRNSSRRANA